MLLLFHITVGIASLVLTSILLLKPTLTVLRVSYLVSAVTIGSGVGLVIITQSSMLHMCLMGVVYAGITIVGVVSGRNKVREAG